METVTLELPTQAYADLQELAADKHSDPINVLVRLIEEARQQQAWLNDWKALQDQIQRDGGLNVGKTTDEIVAQMRQTRGEIWEAEYAHLYR